MSRHVFLHIGDAHLQAGHPRNADRLAALDQVVAYARGCQDLAAILWPGDLFHTKSTAEDRNAIVPRLQQLAAIAPVVICYGNHDVPGDLDIFAKLETEWPIYVVDRPQVLTFRSRGPGVACFVLPYPHKAGLVGAGVAHDELGQEARTALEAIFVSAAAELDQADADGLVAIAMVHVNIGGALSSSGQPQIGREIELDPALLARLGGHYIAANHIHRHQALHGAVYAGSICRMDFGESEAKGFIEIEYTDTTSDWRFVPLQVPRQMHVDGVLTRDRFYIEAVDDVPYDERLLTVPDWTGADVRCRYHFKKSEIGILELAKVHAEFATARSLKLDPVPEIEHAVRAPEVIAARTLDEKVAAYCALNTLEHGPIVQAALAQLQGMDRDAVLASVRSIAEQAGQVEAPAPRQAVA